MNHKPLSCPKCQCSELLLTQVAEIHFKNKYVNGKLVTGGTEEVQDISRQEAHCPKCHHKWNLGLDLDFSKFPKQTDEAGVIEYICIQCHQPKKLRPAASSTFDPSKDICTECEIGIS